MTPYVRAGVRSIPLSSPGSLKAILGPLCRSEADSSPISEAKRRVLVGETVGYERDLALAAIELIAEHLFTAVEDGSNLDAREGMAMAAMMAGSAMCAGCGAVHALGHQLGTEFGMPHGTAMAIMMPYVINFNMRTCVDRLAKVAIALGIDTAHLDHAQAAAAVPFAIRDLTKAVGLPTTLTEYGADPEKIDICVENALKDRNLPDNPIQPSFEEVRTLFEDAFGEFGSPNVS